MSRTSFAHPESTIVVSTDGYFDVYPAVARTNGDKPAGKAKRAKRPRLVPLLMLGSDGEAYACTPAEGVPPSLLKNPNVILAIRLNRRERDIALDALQIGVVEANKTLQGIVGRKFDA